MTPRTLDFKLSVLLLREGEDWVAQCLEYDIAAQGRTLESVKDAFAQAFAARVTIDLARGVQPLIDLASAPNNYWMKFKLAERQQDHLPIPVPSDSLPPTFLIRAMAYDVRICA